MRGQFRYADRPSTLFANAEAGGNCGGLLSCRTMVSYLHSLEVAKKKKKSSNVYRTFCTLNYENEVKSDVCNKQCVFAKDKRKQTTQRMDGF